MRKLFIITILSILAIGCDYETSTTEKTNTFSKSEIQTIAENAYLNGYKDALNKKPDEAKKKSSELANLFQYD